MSDYDRHGHPDDITPAEREELQVASVHGELGAGHAGMALRLADELEREDHRTAARVIRALLELAFPKAPERQAQPVAPALTERSVQRVADMLFESTVLTRGSCDRLAAKAVAIAGAEASSQASALVAALPRCSACDRPATWEHGDPCDATPACDEHVERDGADGPWELGYAAPLRALLERLSTTDAGGEAVAPPLPIRCTCPEPKAHPMGPACMLCGRELR